jgi:hypothetical protein
MRLICLIVVTSCLMTSPSRAADDSLAQRLVKAVYVGQTIYGGVGERQLQIYREEEYQHRVKKYKASSEASRKLREISAAMTAEVNREAIVKLEAERKKWAEIQRQNPHPNTTPWRVVAAGSDYLELHSDVDGSQWLLPIRKIAVVSLPLPAEADARE